MKVWGMPTLLAVLSGVGLIVALVGDAVWDAVGWATLGTPVAVLTWHALRPRWSAAGPEG
jgi:hypothetical protein